MIWASRCPARKKIDSDALPWQCVFAFIGKPRFRCSPLVEQPPRYHLVRQDKNDSGGSFFVDSATAIAYPEIVLVVRNRHTDIFSPA